MRRFLIDLSLLILLAGLLVFAWRMWESHVSLVAPPEATQPPTSQSEASSVSRAGASSAPSSTCTCVDAMRTGMAFYDCYVRTAKGTDQDPNALNDDIQKYDGGSYSYKGTCCYTAAFVSQQCLLWPRSGPSECAELVKDERIRFFIDRSNAHLKNLNSNGWAAYNACEKQFPGGAEAVKAGCPCAPAGLRTLSGTMLAPPPEASAAVHTSSIRSSAHAKKKGRK